MLALTYNRTQTFNHMYNKQIYVDKNVNVENVKDLVKKVNIYT